MARRVVIVGGGAAGMGAAGAAKGTDPRAEVTVYTEFQDAAYSPCGIPYVHGGEIPDFERLFLGTKQQYIDQGIDIRYETAVSAIDTRARLVTVEGKQVPYDSLIVATGFDYADPGVPGSDLGGLYRVKNIREAMEWDKVLDTVQEGGRGRGDAARTRDGDRAGAPRHRDPPDRPQPVGAVDGDRPGHRQAGRGLLGRDGRDPALQHHAHRLPWHAAVRCARSRPPTATSRPTSPWSRPTRSPTPGSRRRPGCRAVQPAGSSSTNGWRRRVPGVWAAGDCTEIPHGVSNVPIQGLSGSHAYAQGKVAGVNAAGGQRAYQPVYVPWGMVAGTWMIGGVSFSETLATALGIPFVLGVAQGISRARYYPDVQPIKVKLLGEPGSLRLIGAQMVGREGIKERADFLAMAVRTGITLRDLATMENVYSPPIGALNEPIALAAQNALGY